MTKLPADLAREALAVRIATRLIEEAGPDGEWEGADPDGQIELARAVLTLSERVGELEVENEFLRQQSITSHGWQGKAERERDQLRAGLKEALDGWQHACGARFAECERIAELRHLLRGEEGK